ncbi:hypothetical protein HGRIS_004251 [Hohenbuehelia grisea]|uniref:Glucose-methanol-choline oxidoreductase N-terminal domain-containing protein n=1 Tax=Hohenbuehelia grisea TaxID=104357 RepID=A0ABR3IP80_9AGAR
MCPNINYPFVVDPDVIAVSHTGLTIAAGNEVLRSPKVLELSGVGNSTILKAVGVQPVLDVATVGENLADHAHSWARQGKVAIMSRDSESSPGCSTTKDILLQNPAFAAEQQAFWLKNRTGLLTALSTSLGIAAPSDIFTEFHYTTICPAFKSTTGHS